MPVKHTYFQILFVLPSGDRERQRDREREERAPNILGVCLFDFDDEESYKDTGNRMKIEMDKEIVDGQWRSDLNLNICEMHSFITRR